MNGREPTRLELTALQLLAESRMQRMTFDLPEAVNYPAGTVLQMHWVHDGDTWQQIEGQCGIVPDPDWAAALEQMEQS